jgi:hypothetical protein
MVFGYLTFLKVHRRGKLDPSNYRAIFGNTHLVERLRTPRENNDRRSTPFNKP